MNEKRWKEIEDIVNALTQIKDRLDILSDEERDDMDEQLADGGRGSSEVMDSWQEVIESLEDASSACNEVVSILSSLEGVDIDDYSEDDDYDDDEYEEEGYDDDDYDSSEYED